MQQAYPLVWHSWKPQSPPKSHFHTLLCSLRTLSMPPHTRMLFFQQSMVPPAVSITAAGAAAVKVWTRTCG